MKTIKFQVRWDWQDGSDDDHGPWPVEHSVSGWFIGLVPAAAWKQAEVFRDNLRREFHGTDFYVFNACVVRVTEEVVA